MTAMIEFDNVSIVFGSDPGRALPLMDQGQTRARDPEVHRRRCSACTTAR